MTPGGVPRAGVLVRGGSRTQLSVPAVVVLAAVLAPMLAHYAPDDQLAESRLLPGREYWLGTDVFGRDILVGDGLRDALDPRLRR